MTDVNPDIFIACGEHQLYRYVAVSHPPRPSHWRIEDEVAVEERLLFGALVLVERVKSL